MKVRILLVEDEESLREMIALNLELEGYEVCKETNGKNGLERFFSENFDMAILDIMLPEIDGFNLCRLIRQHDKTTPIFFLTAKNTALDRVEGLKLGADEYMTKPFNLEEFLLRVKNLIKRAQPLDLKESKLQFGDNLVDLNSMKASNFAGQSIDLSKKECELIKLLFSKNGMVVSREDIIDKIWDKGANPSPRSIDNMVVNFRKYFEINPKEPVFFQSIRGVGYRFES